MFIRWVNASHLVDFDPPHPRSVSHWGRYLLHCKFLKSPLLVRQDCRFGVLYWSTGVFIFVRRYCTQYDQNLISSKVFFWPLTDDTNVIVALPGFFSYLFFFFFFFFFDVFFAIYSLFISIGMSRLCWRFISVISKITSFYQLFFYLCIDPLSIVNCVLSCTLICLRDVPFHCSQKLCLNFTRMSFTDHHVSVSGSSHVNWNKPTGVSVVWRP